MQEFRACRNPLEIRVGKDAAWLLRRIEDEGVDTTHVNVDGSATGHAIIQVIHSGENAIVIYGGANQAVTESDITAALSSCSPQDYFLVQNETSSMAQAIREAHERDFRVVFNWRVFEEK
jgi:ribokinase